MMMTFVTIFGAKYLYLIIAVIALGTVVYTKSISKRSIVKLSVLAFPLSFIIARIASYFIFIPRPFVTEHIQPLITHAADNGFPSDHTLLSMTIASVLFVYNKKVGILLAILAILVGISRVAASVHHPIDIMGSILIAIFSTHIAWHILKKY